MSGRILRGVRASVALASSGALYLAAAPRVSRKIRKDHGDMATEKPGLLTVVQFVDPTDAVVGASSALPAWLRSALLRFSGIRGVDEMTAELARLLPEGCVSTDPDVLSNRGAVFTHHPPSPPEVLVTPTSEADVITVVQLCREYGVPIVPYGGGTALEGQTTCPRGGVLLDFSAMDQIHSVSREDMFCVVDPGIGYVDLNEQLRPHGVWFPVDPGPGATIGGMIATGCSGTHAMRHGTMRRNVLEARVMFPHADEPARLGTRATKTSAGYDLLDLVVGSEGTLGVVTQATLRLQPLPKCTGVGRASFASPRAATRAVADLRMNGANFARCELMDTAMIRAVNRADPEVALREETTLLFEVTGPGERRVDEDLRELQRVTKAFGSTSWDAAIGGSERAEVIWSARKNAFWAATSIRPGADIMVTDVCVPLGEFPAYLGVTTDAIAESGLDAPIVAHAGDGNVHLFIVFDSSDAAEVARAKGLNSDLMRKALACGGTITGEHGIGTGKSYLLPTEVGKSTLGIMREVKHAIDPFSIMNPGMIFPTSGNKAV